MTSVINKLLFRKVYCIETMFFNGLRIDDYWVRPKRIACDFV
jgi:hypothetical protein